VILISRATALGKRGGRLSSRLHHSERCILPFDRRFLPLKTTAGYPSYIRARGRCYIKRRVEHFRLRSFAFRWNRNTQDNNFGCERRRHGRSQPWVAMCSFRRAMAMAIWSARRRSSFSFAAAKRLTSLSCRRRRSAASRLPVRKLRMRSRAWRYSSSSLACSGHDSARVEKEHMKHLLKTSRSNVAVRRTKGKHYFRLLFAFGAMLAFRVSVHRSQGLFL
jgi:hypothetical protein